MQLKIKFILITREGERGGREKEGEGEREGGERGRRREREGGKRMGQIL